MHEVRSVLNQYPVVGEPLNIEPLDSAGGMSGALFWRIRVLRATPDPIVRGFPDSASELRGSPDPAPVALCLRRWPAEHPTPERLRFIHAVLAHAERNGVAFLAVPLRTRTGESFVRHADHLWELAPWLPGAADYERAPSRAKLQAALAALAAFHNALVDFRVAARQPFAGAPPSISNRLTRLRHLAHGGASELVASIDDSNWPELAPLARQFMAALPTAIPPAIAQLEPLAAIALPVQPCLRDIWHDHVLFSGEEVAGIIDYGAVDVDTPATDIARLFGSLTAVSPPRFGEGPGGSVKVDTWGEGLAAYSSVRPLSELERRAVAALDAAGTILAGCNWIRWIYIEGREFENRASIMERFRRLLSRLSM